MKSRLFRFPMAMVLGLVGGSTIRAADPPVAKSHVGSVMGIVTKVESGSITIKVPLPVQTGVTHRHVGSGANRRTVAVPKMGVKYVESTYAIAPALKVKTTMGRSATLNDVHTGDPVSLNVDRISPTGVGEKPPSFLQVASMTIAGQDK